MSIIRFLDPSKSPALPMGPQSVSHPSVPPNAHIELFNNLVKYLVRLRRDGTLDDADFSELVKMASAMFIETEISGRIEGVLDKALENSLPEILSWELR